MEVLDVENEVNSTEKQFYDRLPHSQKTGLRKFYCERMQCSRRSFYDRLKNHNFSIVEKQVFIEFGKQHNVDVYATQPSG